MINLMINKVLVPHTKTVFSDGAIGVKIEAALPRNPEQAFITVRSEGKLNDEFFEISSLVNILRHLNNRINIGLYLPYTPYARQDRCMERHDAFSLGDYADQLNSLKLDKVVILDAHSDVAPALFNNCTNIPQHFILSTGEASDIMGWGNVLVAPDAGASKKILKAAGVLGISHENVVYMEKERDTRNGNILGTKVASNAGVLVGASAIIVDDLVDGGRTFTECASALYAAGATHVGLFVTHGIFARGVQPLIDAGIDRIWTTDSINIHGEALAHDKLKVFRSGAIFRSYF